jgi:hypothetical protein
MFEKDERRVAGDGQREMEGRGLHREIFCWMSFRFCFEVDGVVM